MDIIDGCPEWLSVVLEPAASSNRRWSEISSARRTYSERSLLFIASRYRSMAFFMFPTSLLQVNCTATPSSKKDRGRFGPGVAPCAGLLNEVVEVPIGGIDDPIDIFGFEKGSARERDTGDMPLFRESIEVAGDTPSDSRDRRFRC